MNRLNFLLRFLLLACSVAAPGLLRAEDPNNAIVQATMRYVFQETGVNDPSVTVEKVAGEFARAKVVSVSGSTDPAKAYLRKGSDGKWKVLVLGTGFPASDLAEFGIPASMAN